MTTDEALAQLDEVIAAAPPGERPGLVVQLAARVAQLGAAFAAQPSPAAPAEPDRNLDVGPAAARLGMSVRYLYRHADELGGIKIGGRLKFPSRALDAVIAKGCRRSGPRAWGARRA